MILSFIFLLDFISVFSYICDPSICQINEVCLCANKLIPNNKKREDIPSFVNMFFEDSDSFSLLKVLDEFKEIKDSFNNIMIPTIFINKDNYDYSKLAYYDKIGELNILFDDDDLYHDSIKTKISKNYWDIKLLSTVENIIGIRAEKQQKNEDFLKILNKLEIMYDSSIIYNKTNSEYFWPFLMNYILSKDYSTNYAIIEPLKEIWQFPINNYYGSTNENYGYKDYKFSNKEQFLIDLKLIFEKNYKNNKAPFTLNFKVNYFFKSNSELNFDNINWVKDFLKHIISNYTNVIFSSPINIINWISNKNNLDEILIDQSIKQKNNLIFNLNNSCNNNQYKIQCGPFSICSTESFCSINEIKDLNLIKNYSLLDSLKLKSKFEIIFSESFQWSWGICKTISIKNLNNFEIKSGLASILYCSKIGNISIHWKIDDFFSTKKVFYNDDRKGILLKFYDLKIEKFGRKKIFGFCMKFNEAKSLEFSKLVQISFNGYNQQINFQYSQGYCGNNICEESLGENEENCFVDCGFINCK